MRRVNLNFFPIFHPLRLRSLLLGLGCLLLSCACLTAAADSKPTLAIPKGAVPLDRVIAIVNEVPITQSALNLALTAAHAAIAKNGQAAPSPAVLRSEVLNQLINRQIMLSIAERNNITLSSDELDHAIMNIAAGNKISVDALKKQIGQEGISWTDFRTQLQEEGIISKLQREAIASEVSVTPAEINQVTHSYSTDLSARAEYHVKNLLIPLPTTPSSQAVQAARTQAASLLQKLRKGADFDTLAANSGGSLNGEDLGWRTLAGMPEVFADAIAGKEKGAIAGPVQASNGLHLLKIVDLRYPKGTRLTQDEARSIIFNRKFTEKLTTWLEQMRSQAYIQYP